MELGVIKGPHWCPEKKENGVGGNQRASLVPRGERKMEIGVIKEPHWCPQEE